MRPESHGRPFPPPGRGRRPPRERPSWRAVLWLRRQRVRGRRRFIWAWGVLRLGIPASLLATLLRFVDEPFHLGHFLAHVVANVLVAGVGGGYIMGVLLWALVVGRDGGRPARPRRSTRGRPALPDRPTRGRPAPPDRPTRGWRRRSGS